VAPVALRVKYPTSSSLLGVETELSIAFPAFGFASEKGTQGRQQDQGCSLRFFPQISSQKIVSNVE